MKKPNKNLFDYTCIFIYNLFGSFLYFCVTYSRLLKKHLTN